MEIGSRPALEVVEVQSQRVYGSFHYDVQRRAAYAHCNIQFSGPYKRPAVIFEVRYNFGHISCNHTCAWVQAFAYDNSQAVLPHNLSK